MGFLSFLGGERTDETTGTSTTDQEQTLTGTQEEEQKKISEGVTSVTGTTIEDVTKRDDVVTSEVGTGTSTKETTGTQEGVTSSFSEEALSTLESIFSQIGGKFAGGEEDLASQFLGKLEGFDPQSFISNLVSSAEGSIDRVLTPQLNQLASSVGGNANSAVQLIKQQAEIDKASSLAGVEADATAKANQILTQNISSAFGGRGQDTQLLGLVGDLLKGGRTTTSTEFASEEAAAREEESLGRTVGTSEATSVGSQEQTQVQQLEELIKSLISTDQTTTGTSTTEQEGTATLGGSLAGGLSNLSSFLALGK